MSIFSIAVKTKNMKTKIKLDYLFKTGLYNIYGRYSYIVSVFMLANSDAVTTSFI